MGDLRLNTIGAQVTTDAGRRPETKIRSSGGAGVGQGRLADDLAGGIQDADVMLPVTEIKAEGKPADNSGRLVAP